MNEIKITITAPELTDAIKNLAAALIGKAQPATPAAPVNLTTAQATPQIVRPATMQPTANPTPAPTVPAQAPGVPLSAAPAQTAVPTAPTVPVAAPAPTAPAQAPTVPTSAPQYTIEMIANAGSSLVDAGKMDQLMGLLDKFGVVSIDKLSPDNYGAMATELRALGATI